MTTSPPSASPKALLIIDSKVNVPESWLAWMTEKMPVFRVDADQDGLNRILEILADHANVGSLHLVSHGSPGSLALGNGQLDLAGLIRQAGLLQSIGSHLSTGADLLLYGCNVASGEAGLAFINALAQLTGANVAASDDVTGAAVHGGDWDLERASGEIDSTVLELTGLQGTLATATLTAGADTPVLTTSDDMIVADTASTLNAGDVIDGLEGDDTLTISAAQTVVLGATTLSNVETIAITDGAQNITTHDATVGAGQTLTVDASASTAKLTWNGIAETDGLFLVMGGAAADSVKGGAGADTLYGGGGNDTLSGDAGNDLVFGEGNNDTLYGGAGLDTLYGGDGNDFIYADSSGQVYDDLIYGEAGNDGISGGDGVDTIWGGLGNDTTIGGTGGDSLLGGEGNDWLWGQNDDDVVYGDAGNDSVSGNAGDDTLYGGDGSDTLSGHDGADVLYGGAENDTFTGSAADHDGDTIADFGEDDSIVLSGVDLSALNETAASGTLDLGGGQSLTLTGITAASGTFAAVYAGGATTITLEALPEPPPAPAPDVEIIPVDGVDTIIKEANGIETITVPVVSSSRQDDPESARPTYADIPVLRDPQGEVQVVLSVPAGVGLTIDGLIELPHGDDAATDLLQRITTSTPSGSDARAAMQDSARNFIESMSGDSPIGIRTVVPFSSGPSDPVVISGVPGTGQYEALVINMLRMSPGSTLQLDNIEFAAVIGASRIVGGAGTNVVLGDAAAQFIVLGADDDMLSGGSGNDTVGSLAGNDQTFGDQGDDVVYGGAGHDTLSGGEGSDSLNGGSGFDIALLTGSRADYALDAQGDGLVVTHVVTGETDSLTDIERIHFSGGEVLAIAHSDNEAIAYHLVSTWLERDLTAQEAEAVQNPGAASVGDLVNAFKNIAPLSFQNMTADELLAGLAANPEIFQLSMQRREYFGDEGNDQGYPPWGLAMKIDGAGGHDVLRLQGSRDDYHLTERNGVLDITRYEDGAMLNLRNAEMISFDSGENVVLAHDKNEALLARLVHTFLDRDASIDEWEVGREALSGDIDAEGILAWFEKRAGLEQLDDEHYIHALYENTFDREATAQELSDHLEQLDDTGLDRSWLAVDIAGSEEAVAIIGNVMFIDGWI